VPAPSKHSHIPLGHIDRYSFNIWALTAAAKAVEHKLRHKSSKSKLNELTSLTPAKGSVSPVDNDVASQPTTDPSPSSTAPTSATTSASPSVIDFTKPMINTSAADAANAETLENDDLESEASCDSDSSSSSQNDRPSTGIVTVSGSEPPVGPDNIISERVSTHGKIRPFEPIHAVPALDPNLRESIGQVHSEGAIKKWLAKRAEWDAKYSRELAKWREIKQNDRRLAEENGFLTRDLHGDRPPLGSLAGVYDRDLARQIGKSVDEVSKKTSGAMLLWYKMSTKVGPRSNFSK
jgi:hypothetical protein